MKAVKIFMAVVIVITITDLVRIMAQEDLPFWPLLIASVLGILFWLAVALIVRWLVILVRRRGTRGDNTDPALIPNKDAFVKPEVPSPRVPSSPRLISAGILDHKGCRGSWTLDDTGLLHYQGNDILDTNGGAQSYRRAVRKIVIDGFWCIEPHTFENFPECEEVVFNAEHVQIAEMAFAHCTKLRTVSFKESHEAADDAFRDTPYQADLQGIDYIPESQQQGPLSSAEWGAKFISNIHEEVEMMKTMKSPLPQRAFGRWTPDDYDWFASSLDILDKGAEAGAAEMLYLAAEYKTFAGSYTINEMEDFCLYRKLWLSDKNAADMYLAAAEKDFPHAMLWCSYCYSNGSHGFEQDPEKSAQLLDQLKSSGKMPRTIGLQEFLFLKSEVDDLVDMAYDADYTEDMVAAQSDSDMEKFRLELPNPEWGTLHLRTIELVNFMACIGLPFVLTEQGYDYQWNSTDTDRMESVKTVKTAWLNWCVEQGLEITME